MSIDIDRLHDVLSGKMRGRGKGHTYSQLVRLAGMVDFCPEKQLCFVAATRNGIDEARESFRSVLRDMDMINDLVVFQRQYVRFRNGCVVHFTCPGASFQSSLRGLRLENIEIDHFAESHLSLGDIDFINTRLV